MRKLIILFLVFSLNIYGAAPTGYKNETATAKTYAQDLVFPNNQLTKQAGLDSRIETGNKNLLTNASFEHSTVTTGWTVTNATASADTTNMVEGKKALSLSLTGALAVTQDSTINAANVVGLQGNASIKIKTSNVDGLKVCARNAGVTSTSLCVNVPMDGVWKEINIPFIMTATSNGIAITSTGTTGTVIIDDAFVGTSAPFQNVNGARLVGGVTITGCAGRFQTTSTTFASFGTQTGCVYTTFGQAVQPSVTNLPVIKFASLPPGDYIVEYTGAIFNATTGNNTWIKFHDGTGYMREEPWLSLGTSGGGGMAVSGSFSYSTTQSNITFEARGKIQNGTGNIVGSTAEPGVIKVFYYPPESKIYSQASRDVAYQPCTFSTLAWQGLGTVTNNLQCARKGQNLLMKGRFTLGTVSASIAQLPLPTNFGTITTASSVPSTSYASGLVFREAASANTLYSIVQSPSVTYVNFSGQLGNTTINPNNALTGSSLWSNGDTISVPEIAIPIQGWQDYGVIVGSFAGLEKCNNSYDCTDSFTAYLDGSTNVISNENLDWINGNCTGTTTKTCTLNNFLKDGTNALSNRMNCTVTPYTGNATPGSQMDTTTSSTQLVFVAYQGTTPTQAAAYSIHCQKTGSDYAPKTAKIATSIGVPTVPGITTTGTGNTIDTFSFSYGTTNATTVCSASPCSYLDQIGTAVTSVTRSGTGAYTANFTKTYAKLKCSFYCMGGVVCGSGQAMSCSNCSSLSYNSYNTNSFAIQDSFGVLMCQGSY